TWDDADPHSINYNRAYFRQFFYSRYAEDQLVFTDQQLNDIETLYSVAINNWNTQMAIDSLISLVENPEYSGANRIGCSLLYLAQMSTDSTEYLNYLLQAFNDGSDSWYGNGVNVGAYACFLLIEYYDSIGNESEYFKYKDILSENYLNYIDHRERYLDNIL
ncbi:MAG: hypothetical protein JEY91_17735, partial [Spirochaetaceae bacterium]|nr:hypothetical protein [Spirochaetaceae bacterium]